MNNIKLKVFSVLKTQYFISILLSSIDFNLYFHECARLYNAIIFFTVRGTTSIIGTRVENSVVISKIQSHILLYVFGTLERRYESNHGSYYRYIMYTLTNEININSMRNR